MTRLRQFLEQRSIHITAQTERKNANRGCAITLVVQRFDYPFQVSRSDRWIRVGDQDDTVFARRKLRRNLDCLYQCLAYVGCATEHRVFNEAKGLFYVVSGGRERRRRKQVWLVVKNNEIKLVLRRE